MLVVGVLGLGGGMLAVSLSTSLVTVAPALLAAALGFGLVSTVAFPLFSTLIPNGEAGGYTALFFSVRSISSAIALPAAGWTVEVTGTYRALFVLGGGATLVALVPLLGVVRPEGRTVTIATLLAAVPVLGLLVAQTGVHRLDESLFRAINGLGPGPELLWTVLDPHTRNYVVLIVLAARRGGRHAAGDASPPSSRACSAPPSSPGGCSRPSTRSTTGRGPRRS